MTSHPELRLLQRLLNITDQADGRHPLAQANGLLAGNDVAQAAYELHQRIQAVIESDNPEHNVQAVGLLREVANLIRRGRKSPANTGTPVIYENDDSLSDNDVARALIEMDARMLTVLAADPHADLMSQNYVPPWLNAIMSPADRAIVQHRLARFLTQDNEGNRLPAHQQWIESPVGSMWIDAKEKAILGYGPGSQRHTEPALREAPRP